MYDPTQDGISHINVYSAGKTVLGRQLSNFAYTPFELDGDTFNSVEGYWYWYFTGKQHNELKKLIGYGAKKRGKELRDDRLDKNGITEEDKTAIKRAISAKINASVYIQNLMQMNKLPYVHYYTYGDKVVHPAEYDWLMDHLNGFRM